MTKTNPNPQPYVVFGGGAFLSDIFDLIHAIGGVVEKVYLNMPDSPKQGGLTVQQRIDLIEEDVELFDTLDTFEPEDGRAYVLAPITVHKHALIQELKERFGITIASLIHPSVQLGSNVRLGEGLTINASTVIAPNAHLDDFCSVNRMSMIGHDAYVGKYTRIGPTVSMAGGTHIGDCCSIGIASTILDYVKVGQWSVVGAGAVVTRDVPERVVSLGIPAKVVKENPVTDIKTYHDKRTGKP
jgi:sugar O-acyltransferase (sialic acid O-acetyltransferase NeuD family)